MTGNENSEYVNQDPAELEAWKIENPESVALLKQGARKVTLNVDPKLGDEE